MSETISESKKIEKRLNFKDELPKWKGKIKEQSSILKEIKVEKIDQKLVNNLSKKAAKFCLSIDASPSRKIDVPIVEKEISKNPSVKFSVMISPDGSMISFKLELPNNEGSPFSILTFRDIDGALNMQHRYTDPRIREQGLASILLSGVESFLKTIAQKTGNPCRIVVDLAQLDLLCWVNNRGFKGATMEDDEKIEKVLNADARLRLGQDYYIYPIDLPEKDEDPKEKMKNSYLMKLEKKIVPKQRVEALDGIKRGIRFLLHKLRIIN